MGVCSRESENDSQFFFFCKTQAHKSTTVSPAPSTRPGNRGLNKYWLVFTIKSSSPWGNNVLPSRQMGLSLQQGGLTGEQKGELTQSGYFLCAVHTAKHSVHIITI